MRIYRDFLFEAAHYLPSAPPGHPNSRIHGHSFRARVWIDGEPGADTGVVFHFDDLSAALADCQDALDHRMLNDVEGLSAPTLERIAMWIWDRHRQQGARPCANRSASRQLPRGLHL